MKIVSLLVNNFKNDNRVYRIARSLHDKGHAVRVVGLLKGAVQEREDFKGVEVHRIRLRSLVLPENNKFYGAIKYIEFFAKAVWTYRKWDIWHCNDFEAYLVGCVAKMTRPQLKLVYDCHEYERERYGLKGFVKWFVGTFERLLISWSHVVIVVGPSILKEYVRLYKVKNIYLVRNTPHLKPLSRTNTLREKLGIRDGQKIFLYQGMISGGRGIEVLIDAFEHRRTDDAVVVFMGHGKLAHLAEEAARRSSNIFFLPSVPYEEIYAYTGSADVGMNTPQNHCLSYYYCFPNKLFEYIQSGIPILTNNLPDCRELVLTEGIGDVIEPYTAEGVNQAVDRMILVPREQFRAALDRAREKYHWELEEKELFKAYATIGA